MISIKDFSMEDRGSSKRRLGYKHNINSTTKGVFYRPAIKIHIEVFEFHFKIHRIKSRYLFLGVGSGKQNLNISLGNDEDGWSLGSSGRSYHTYFHGSCGGGSTREFEVGDVVQFEVNRKRKTIRVQVRKEGEEEKWVKLFRRVEFPRNIVISGSAYWRGDEFELIYFKIHSLVPRQINRLMDQKEQEERNEELTMREEIDKMKEDMCKMKKVCRFLVNSLEKMKQEKKRMKKKIEVLQDQVDELSSSHHRRQTN